MAQIVGGFLMPHNPIITSSPPELGNSSQRASVFGSFAEIKRRVHELGADTAVVIGADHYTIFGPHCIPQCLIGIGDVDGPIEPWLNVERGPIANNGPLARHILEQGWADRIDWAFAKALTVDHAIAVPYHLTVRGNPGLRTIPVYLNAAVEPCIGSRRAAQVGASIRRAVESWDRDERVVIYGTGGLSHWVGCKGTGQVNEDFDRRILDICERGDVEALIEMPDEFVDREGGNGCLEIKNWICAMAAMGDVKAETIAYEPMPEWITGLAFAQLNPIAA